MKTILITGPESSGKSTLTKQLAEQSECPYLSEYAREYLEEHGPEYGQETLLCIAKEHVQRYHILRKKSKKLPCIFLDTYLLNLKIWSLEKYNVCDPYILKQLDIFYPDLVLLCTPDIPWEEDTLRENPKDRERLYKRFSLEIKEYKWDVHNVNKANRANKINEYVRKFISKV